MKKNRRARALLEDSLASYRQAPADEAQIREIRAESNRAIAARDIVGVSAGLGDDFVVVIGTELFLIVRSTSQRLRRDLSSLCL